MNEENKFSPKNKWTRIFRKKWFFPSMYLILAALLISAVVWYQNTGTEQAVDMDQVEEIPADEALPVSGEGESDEDIVVEEEEEEETIQMPMANPEDAVIKMSFFDYDEEATRQANALIHYNNRYYQSTGVAIGQADEESFDVVAALSGTVEEVKEDPLMGDVVVLAHEDEVTTYYASLAEVAVAVGDEVAQGDKLGVAAKNIFGQENGIHVHFEMEKDNEKVNPETYFHTPVSSIDIAEDPVEEEQEEQEEQEEEEQEQEADEESELDEITE